MKKISLFLIVCLLLLLSVPVFADESITMNPVNNSGISGTATITSLGSNQIRVDVTLNGLKPNDQRAGHIHKGSCQNEGPVVYPLNPVVANAQGVGTSSTTVTLNKEPITPGNFYVNFHQGLNPPGGGVSCGNITQAYGTAATTAGGLPKTGDSDLPAMAALAALGLLGAGYYLRRRSN